MNSTIVKVPAKLNLTLDIVGKEKEYQQSC